MLETATSASRRVSVSHTRKAITASARLAPVGSAGKRSLGHFTERFAETIQNSNTRAAYLHAVRSFAAWCSERKVAEVKTGHVADYIAGLAEQAQQTTIRQHLAAIRKLFDWLIANRIVAKNPARAVTGPKCSPRHKTPALTMAQARKLLDGIDTSSVVGLRDRAAIGLMMFAFARIGSVVAMRVGDYYRKDREWWIRLQEKGGRQHELRADPTLQGYLDGYIAAAGIRNRGDTPLFRSAAGGTGLLTEKAMNRVDAWRMVQRRAAGLGTRTHINCHTFRATGIAAYLAAGGTLEGARVMAAHASPRTTKLYDRPRNEGKRSQAGKTNRTGEADRRSVRKLASVTVLAAAKHPLGSGEFDPSSRRSGPQRDERYKSAKLRYA